MRDKGEEKWEEGKKEMKEVERKILVLNLEFWFFLNQAIKNKLSPLSLSFLSYSSYEKISKQREKEKERQRERESLEPSNFVFRSDLLLREKSHGSCELNVVHYSLSLSLFLPPSLSKILSSSHPIFFWVFTLESGWRKKEKEK